jgi:universal stress protein A
MSDYKNIIVAIDINAEHKCIIKKALTISKTPEKLKLVYIPLPNVYLQPYLYGVDYDALDDTNRIERAREKLEAIAKKYGISPSNTYLKLGNATDEIKLYANEIKADLIVIGTHGRSGFSLLLGSTANSILHGAKQDVLAVRVYE